MRLSVHLLSQVQLCHPMNCNSQVSLSISNSQSYSNSCPVSQWWHSTISFSVFPFSSRLQSFPASESFQMSQFFESGGQSIGVSALASVLPMNIKDWFPLGWTGRISLQSKLLSRVFSNTIVQKHQFFSVQKWMLNFIKSFFCITEMIIFILIFVNMMYHIDWFADIEIFLFP